jgi:hypothetical protein
MAPSRSGKQKGRTMHQVVGATGHPLTKTRTSLQTPKMPATELECVSERCGPSGRRPCFMTCTQVTTASNRGQEARVSG